MSLGQNGVLPFKVPRDARTQQAAQVEDARVDDEVNRLGSLTLGIDQSDRAQHGEVLGGRRLPDGKPLDKRRHIGGPDLQFDQQA